MKFGKTDEEKKRSKSIYESLIKPAAITSGYNDADITRADIEAEAGGSMKKQIFQNLYDADLIIADITGGNPNVFYELGIRHTFKKRGTIIMRNTEEQSIPFDLADDYIHPYVWNIDVLSEEREKLTSLIEKRKTNKTDSPVFDRMPELEKKFDSGDPAANLSKENTDLRSEIEKLQTELGKYEGLPKIEDDELNFSKADQALELYGIEIKNALTRYRSEGDEKGFRKTLNKISSTNEYIDAFDFVDIARLCNRMNLYPHKIMILEHAYEKFPRNDRVFISLMDSYIASPSKLHNDMAKQMLLEYYKIKPNANGKLCFTEESKSVKDYSSSQKLSTIFDLFLSQEEDDDALSIIESAEQFLDPDPILIKRNKAFVYRRLGKHHDAINIFEELIQDNPSDMELRLIADSFIRIREPEIAYQFFELRAINEYDTAKSYIELAEGIERSQIVRTKDGFKSARPNIRIAKRTIVPLLLKALSIAPYEETIIDVKSELFDVKADEERRYLNENPGGYDTLLEKFKEGKYDIYDWDTLDFIEGRSKNDLNIKDYVRNILEGRNNQ